MASGLTINMAIRMIQMIPAREMIRKKALGSIMGSFHKLRFLTKDSILHSVCLNKHACYRFAFHKFAYGVGIIYKK